MMSQLPTPVPITGVAVTAVAEQVTAGKLGLQAGDVIVVVNAIHVTNVSALRAVIGELGANYVIDILFVRRGLDHASWSDVSDAYELKRTSGLVMDVESGFGISVADEPMERLVHAISSPDKFHPFQEMLLRISESVTATLDDKLWQASTEARADGVRNAGIVGGVASIAALAGGWFLGSRRAGTKGQLPAASG